MNRSTMSLVYVGLDTGMQKEYEASNMPGKKQLRKDFPKDRKVKRIMRRLKRRSRPPRRKKKATQEAYTKREKLITKTKIIDLCRGKMKVKDKQEENGKKDD